MFTALHTILFRAVNEKVERESPEDLFLTGEYQL